MVDLTPKIFFYSNEVIKQGWLDDCEDGILMYISNRRFRGCARKWGEFQIIRHHHMKNHVELDHLTDSDDFMLNGDRAVDL